LKQKEKLFEKHHRLFILSMMFERKDKKMMFYHFSQKDFRKNFFETKKNKKKNFLKNTIDYLFFL
jgi:hypothetical protein